jgi:hypothetical protein
MRFSALAATLMVLAAVPAFAQASKAATEKAIVANENKINDAVAKHDLKTFNELVAPDAVSGDDAGFMKVADFTKTIDQLKVSTWHIMNTQVMWIDDKSAVLTYTWMGKGTYMNQPIPETTYASSVWTERNGKWVVVYHQETPARPPAAKK